MCRNNTEISLLHIFLISYAFLCGQNFISCFHSLALMQTVYLLKCIHRGILEFFTLCKQLLCFTLLYIELMMFMAYIRERESERVVVGNVLGWVVVSKKANIYLLVKLMRVYIYIRNEYVEGMKEQYNILEIHRTSLEEARNKPGRS